MPCTGPLIISAFVIGGVRSGGALAENLVNFVFFGLWFGWPLVLLPLIAAPAQRHLTGLLLVAFAGWWYDIRPN